MIVLWELGGANDRRYSLFSWRTRMALAHKALEFEALPVRMSDKAAIAFSGGKTVPIIRDGEDVVRDSWKIAEHLESRYPQKPLFGGDIGRGVSHAFNVWVDRALVGAMLRVLAPEIHERVDAADREHFRAMAERATRSTLDELRSGGEEALQRLGRGLEPMQALLKRQAYVCGEQPAYADYALFSIFQWARVMSPRELLAPEDPLSAWRERVLDLFGGLARNVVIA
ncbi:MAG TPA: glutathione S-transferase N-terminal domain-containing protein [Burkholderiales bacterium]|nr:glutathione S-transferase N-terminal domain-containing protein [Burkholderiales bacterium]